MSQRQRIELQPAFLLHTYDYRDSSKIAEFLVRENGRVAAVARGVKRPTSRHRGLLQPFQPLLVSWSGRELGTLTGLEPAAPRYALQRDAVLAGFYLNELCLKLLASQDPHPEIHDLLDDSFRALAIQQPVARVLRRFELGLLEALGYGLNLTAEPGTGEAVDPDSWYLFHVHSGPERRAEHVKHPMCVHGSSLLAMEAGIFEREEVLRDAQRILRSAIDAHLSGRTLKSRDVVRAMYRGEKNDNEGTDD